MSVYAFTSVTVNYIPKARVLARSLHRVHPEIKFILVLAESLPPGLRAGTDDFDDIITIADLGGPALPSWLFQHTLVETCTALKGFFVEKIFERRDCESVLYFDPDIVVFHRVDAILDLLREHPIVLTPHQVDPESASDAVMDNEICSLKHGIYNLGFLGVSNSPVGRDFARWWRERLDRHCFDDIPNGLFTDQRWADLVPALFDGVHILRDRTYNVATWNIAHRRIEGSVDTGILADGQPLKFFHFSGFDSGAQLTMLRGYGGSMPAAFALRAWYIDECAKLDPENYTALPWPYDSFDDGEPVTKAQRRTYRDRLDLQRAFPDPFRAVDGEPSFRRWYAESVPAEDASRQKTKPSPVWASEAVRDNPLAHFLFEGAGAGLDPHPLFSTTYYLDCNPEVAAAGGNPLVDFVTRGEDENRDPHPEFRTRFYRQENPDLDASGLGPIAHYCEIGRPAGARPTPLFNSIRDRALLEDTAQDLRNAKPTLLFVSHYSGGGTGRHVRDLLGRYRRTANFVLLEPTREGTVSAMVHVSGGATPTVFEFDALRHVHHLVDAIRRFEPSRIHIHHLLGNEAYLRTLVGGLGIPFDYTVHDYYVLSPEPHFAGAGGHFVGEPTSDKQRELFEYGIGPGTTGPTSLAAWQASHRWLIERADRVIVPSHDVDRRLRSFGITRATVVAPHPDALYRCEEVSAKRLARAGVMRVLILGELNFRKGLLLVQDCVIAAERRRLPIEFHLVGYLAAGMRQAAQDNLKIHGRYREEDLEGLVATVDPHIAWFPMTSLETYCYTLSTALALELPVVSTDLGPFPERLEGRPWTWIEPWDSPCERWLDLFMEIGETLGGLRRPPEPVTPAPHADGAISNGSANFYDREYLAPALAAFGAGRRGAQARR